MSDLQNSAHMVGDCVTCDEPKDMTGLRSVVCDKRGRLWRVPAQAGEPYVMIFDPGLGEIGMASYGG